MKSHSELSKILSKLTQKWSGQLEACPAGQSSLVIRPYGKEKTQSSHI